MSSGVLGALTIGLALGMGGMEPEPELEYGPEPEPELGEAEDPAVDEEPDDAPTVVVEPAEFMAEPAEAPEEPEPTEASKDAPEPVGLPTADPSHDVPADDFESHPGTAPGGYYGHGVILEREPPDGRSQIVVGSILVPLGTLAAVSSAGGVWLYAPAHCEERLARLGTPLAEDGSCTGAFTLNVIRTTTGALMLASGATILAIGLVRRQRYRKWRNEHGLRARVEPVLSPGRRGAMGGLRVRF